MAVVPVRGPRGAVSLVRLRLHLPGPLPGLNELVAAAKRRSGTGWNGYAALKRQWMAVLAPMIAGAKLPRLSRAWIGFRWLEPARRRDPDNIAAGGRKLVLDALVAAGVLPGDGWRGVLGWSDRFAVDARRPGVTVTLLGLARRLALAGVLLAAAPAAAETSPVNLAPGWPLRLDDPYPVTPGDWQLQTALRQDWSSGANRVTLRTDVRVGLRESWELDVGFTPAQAGSLGGDPVDHRAVRVSVLARVTRQDGGWPAQAVRLTVAPAIAGGSRAPSLQADWLDSWKVGARAWVHLNASYLVAPDPFPGGFPPGRRDWWQARLGGVYALAPSGLALAGSVGILPSPFLLRDQLRADPELALLVPLARGLVVSVGGGVLVQSDNVMRAQVGLSWTF
ncbi:hypothetical protein [Nitrospira calida]